MDVKFSLGTWEGETPQVRGLHGLTPKQTPHDSQAVVGALRLAVVLIAENEDGRSS